MILVTGAGGQLGAAFMRLLGPKATYLSRRELDITDRASVSAVVSTVRPELIVNCAAWTDVDAAEDRVDEAFAVNAEGVGNLADAAARTGSRLVTFSTDYVFAGDAGPYSEDDPTTPINVYGKSKVAGERIALDRGAEVLVVRTSWLLSGTHRCFATTALRLATSGGAVVDDQWGRPTMADDLASTTLDAVRAGTTGLLHVANEGETTWYRLAVEIAETAGSSGERIRPCRSQDHPTKAQRPARATLDTSRLERLGLGPLAHHRERLDEIVAGQLAVMSGDFDA